MKRVNNYFSHDLNARNDIKMKRLIMQQGLEGVGLYWCIVECLYENNGYLTLDNDVELLSYELRIDKNKILDLINNFELFKKNKTQFYSPSVIKRLEKINEKSNKNRENVLKRWSKNKENQGFDDDTNVLQEKYENDTNVLQTNYYIKENKIKENKIKKNKINNILTTTTMNNIDIYSYVEQNFGRTLSPIEIEKINSWSLELEEEVIKYAISIAVMNRKSTFAYVDGILKNWKGQGFKTVSDIKEHEETNYKSYQRDSLTDEQRKDLDEIFDYNWLDDEDDT